MEIRGRQRAVPQRGTGFIPTDPVTYSQIPLYQPPNDSFQPSPIFQLLQLIQLLSRLNQGMSSFAGKQPAPVDHAASQRKRSSNNGVFPLDHTAVVQQGRDSLAHLLSIRDQLTPQRFQSRLREAQRNLSSRLGTSARFAEGEVERSARQVLAEASGLVSKTA